MIKQWIKSHRKFLVAVVAAAAIAIQAAITDDVISHNEWVKIGLAVLGALGVTAIPNTGTGTERPAEETAPATPPKAL